MEKTVWVLEWDCNLEGVFSTKEAAFVRAIKLYKEWLEMEHSTSVAMDALVESIILDLDDLLNRNRIEDICFIMELPYYEKEEK